MIIEVAQISDIKIKADDTHIHLQQNDPITSAINWISLSKDDLQAFIDVLKSIENGSK